MTRQERIELAKKQWHEEKEKADNKFQGSLDEIREFITDPKLESSIREKYLKQRDEFRKTYEFERMKSTDTFIKKIVEIKGSK